VRDSGRKTPRGAVVWWAGNGRKPLGHLTPSDAEAALKALLAAAAPEPTDPRHRRRGDHTFGEACEAWLAYIAHEKDRRPSTVKDYGNTVRRYLLAEFGAETLLHTIDTERQRRCPITTAGAAAGRRAAARARRPTSTDEGDAMATAVIGATRVSSEIVRGLLACGEAVAALVRDPGKARRAFGEPGGLHIRATRLDDPRAFDGIRAVFIAMGRSGSRACCSGSRSARPPGSRRSSRHPPVGAQRVGGLTGDQPSAPTTASPGSPRRPRSRARRSARRSALRALKAARVTLASLLTLSDVMSTAHHAVVCADARPGGLVAVGDCAVRLPGCGRWALDRPLAAQPLQRRIAPQRRQIERAQALREGDGERRSTRRRRPR